MSLTLGVTTRIILTYLDLWEFVKKNDPCHPEIFLPPVPRLLSPWALLWDFLVWESHDKHRQRHSPARLHQVSLMRITGEEKRWFSSLLYEIRANLNISYRTIAKYKLNITSWNLNHPFIYGCFNWMIQNLYIGNGCFTKHPFKTGCLGFQVILHTSICNRSKAENFNFRKQCISLKANFCDISWWNIHWSTWLDQKTRSTWRIVNPRDPQFATFWRHIFTAQTVGQRITFFQNQQKHGYMSSSWWFQFNPCENYEQKQSLDWKTEHLSPRHSGWKQNIFEWIYWEAHVVRMGLKTRTP